MSDRAPSNVPGRYRTQVAWKLRSGHSSTRRWRRRYRTQVAWKLGPPAQRNHLLDRRYRTQVAWKRERAVVMVEIVGKSLSHPSGLETRTLQKEQEQPRIVAIAPKWLGNLPNSHPSFPFRGRRYRTQVAWKPELSRKSRNNPESSLSHPSGLETLQDPTRPDYESCVAIAPKWLGNDRAIPAHEILVGVAIAPKWLGNNGSAATA